MGLGNLCFLIAADCTYDGCALLLQPLAGDHANAACCRMEQDGVARLDFVGSVDEVGYRQALEQHTSGLSVADVVRQGDKSLRWIRALFGIRPRRPHHITDAVADFDVLNAVTDRIDYAHAFHTYASRQGQFVAARALIDIYVVQADLCLTQSRFTGTRLHFRDFLPLHYFWCTLFMNFDCVRQ